jgi:DNA primase
MYTKESIENLRQIADPKEVLMSIGGVSAANMLDNGYEVRCCCPLHGGDNASGFSWRLQDGVWTCFTKGCGDGSGRDVFAFVQHRTGCSFREAVESLAEMFGFSLEEGEVSGMSDYLRASKVRKDLQIISQAKITKQEHLKSLPGYYEKGKADVYAYLASRGYYDPTLIEMFNLYPCVDAFGYLRLGIPAYDEEGELVGVNARRMDGILLYPEEVQLSNGTTRQLNKYEMVANFKKGLVLFNLCRAKEQSLQKGLILVEGELSCIRMVSYGFTNTVAMRGARLTHQQTLLLYKHCFNLTILVEAGEAAEEGTIRNLEMLPGMKVRVAKLEHGDPDDNSKEEITQALENARLYTAEDLVYTKETGKLL